MRNVLNLMFLGSILSVSLTCSPDVSKEKPKDSDAEVEKRGLMEQFRDFREYFSEMKHAKVLFATSASWFLL